ncbi:Pimeloyl-ACP methyl ester carboxylesterase [Cryobacterium psychrotolerans]|uniref:Pimeloyl-ACP methyl ester carboxylesterase n=2 Tax=Microbacteriaceae TaxID=85023 RepID=A0A1G9F9E4_9MICO|nr:Pimeloyl-ACP methyl ester carboxylesterase [Cryobacterium psychrotolerans]
MDFVQWISLRASARLCPPYSRRPPRGYDPCMADQTRNPFALPGAEAPRAGLRDVNGCRLHTEVRGSGPTILIIGAASDDAEMFRPIAERLTGFTVVTYDPRGTLRSSRDGWPCDSTRHAEDAAELLRTLGLGAETRADVFGSSAGGIVALQLALRHPELVRRVTVFEPGYFQLTASGRALASRVGAQVDRHLAAHPGDWAGAMALVSGVARVERPDDKQPGVTQPGARPSGLLAAPAGLEWYAARGEALAENLIRGDLPVTGESVDLRALATSAADIRFALGSASHPVFGEIARELTRVRRRPGSADPEEPDVIDGVGHVVCFAPEPVAEYIRRRCA